LERDVSVILIGREDSTGVYQWGQRKRKKKAAAYLKKSKIARRSGFLSLLGGERAPPGCPAGRTMAIGQKRKK